MVKEKKKEPKYNVTINYRNGSKEVFFNVDVARPWNTVFEIEEGKRTTYIMLRNISFIEIEEAL